MAFKGIPFSELISEVVDNRGRTCPTVENGIPLIATNCLRNEFLYPTYDKSRFVSRETYSTWFRGHPLPGDILFVNKATPGRVCLVPDPVDFCIAQDMVAVRADPKRIYPKYLFAALRAPVVQEQIAQMHVGTLIPHFKKSDFNKLRIPVPGPDYQRFIGDTYFELSAKIDLNRRMNETLEAMSRAIFKSWFVDFDPVRAKAEGREPAGMDAQTAALFPDSFEESDLGAVPRGWTLTSLRNLVGLVVERVDAGTTKDALRYIALDDMPSRSLSLSFSKGRRSTAVSPRSRRVTSSSVQCGLIFTRLVSRPLTASRGPRHSFSGQVDRTYGRSRSCTFSAMKWSRSARQPPSGRRSRT